MAALAADEHRLHGSRPVRAVAGFAVRPAHSPALEPNAVLAGEVLFQNAILRVGLSLPRLVVACSAKNRNCQGPRNSVGFHPPGRFPVAHAGPVARLARETLPRVPVCEKVGGHFGMARAAQLMPGRHLRPGGANQCDGRHQRAKVRKQIPQEAREAAFSGVSHRVPRQQRFRRTFGQSTEKADYTDRG